MLKLKPVLSLFSLLCFLIASTATLANASDQSTHMLTQLVVQRARLMKQVAAYKWLHEKSTSVYDAKQELAVLKRSQQFAMKQHLDVNRVLIFTQLQMDLSKRIEQTWIHYWNNPRTPKAKPPNNENVLSLTELRAKIKAIDKRFYDSLTKHAIALQLASVNEISHQLQTQFAQHKNVLKGIPSKSIIFDPLALALKEIRPS